MPRKEATLRDLALFLHKHLSKDKDFCALIEKWKAGHKITREMFSRCLLKKRKKL